MPAAQCRRNLTPVQRVGHRRCGYGAPFAHPGSLLAVATGFVLDPTASMANDISSPGPDAGDLKGKLVGIRLDQIWRAWDWISEIWAQEFRRAGAEVKFWRSCGRSGEEGERMAAQLEEFLACVDIAVVGLANCGSCTGWTVHDALAAACQFRAIRQDTRPARRPLRPSGARPALSTQRARARRGGFGRT